MPIQRKIAKIYSSLELPEIQDLLSSSIHEFRLVALIILIDKYKMANKQTRKEIFDFYLSNTRNINNWDLVDLSAPKIVGHYFLENDRKMLYKLARSSHLWEKRISIIATFELIRNKQYDDALKISEILLSDKHDLIHKAVGWMLREIGKRDRKAEELFLDEHIGKMPRTMLRYAIEKFDEPRRKYYLSL